MIKPFPSIHFFFLFLFGFLFAVFGNHSGLKQAYLYVFFTGIKHVWLSFQFTEAYSQKFL